MECAAFHYICPVLRGCQPVDVRSKYTHGGVTPIFWGTWGHGELILTTGFPHGRFGHFTEVALECTPHSAVDPVMKNIRQLSTISQFWLLSHLDV
jgi:hypothetical protein